MLSSLSFVYVPRRIELNLGSGTFWRFCSDNWRFFVRVGAVLEFRQRSGRSLQLRVGGCIVVCRGVRLGGRFGRLVLSVLGGRYAVFVLVSVRVDRVDLVCCRERSCCASPDVLRRCRCWMQLLDGRSEGYRCLEAEAGGGGDACFGCRVEDVVDLSFADAHEDEASELEVYVGYFHKFVPVHFVRIWMEYLYIVFEADSHSAVPGIVLAWAGGVGPRAGFTFKDGIV